MFPGLRERPVVPGSTITDAPYKACKHRYCTYTYGDVFKFYRVGVGSNDVGSNSVAVQRNDFLLIYFSVMLVQ